MSPGSLIDSHGRVLRDLRISVTDRCNFRCLYCLPETEAAAHFYRGRFSSKPWAGTEQVIRQWQPYKQILTFEEIERVVRLASELGMDKIRLTGGEPLLRQQLERLVALIARLPGVRDLALTTNGFLFLQKGRALRDAGLKRVNISLDSLDRENFKRLTGRDGLAEVLQAIELARELGLNPVKVNAVIIRGLNDHEVPVLARFAREHDLRLRFIEFMPLDSGRAWQKDCVMSAADILRSVRQECELEPLALEHASATARRWSFVGGRGELGIIAPVTEPFCGHCNRLRLTADGKIRTCLFSMDEHDLRALLRGGATDAEIVDFLHRTVGTKEERHHIGEPGFTQPERTMSCIGG